jgi:hypothetical protein
MFRNLSLAFKVLDFRVIGEAMESNHKNNLIWVFLKIQPQVFMFSFYVKMVKRIFGFRILRSTQAIFSNLKNFKAKFLDLSGVLKLDARKKIIKKYRRAKNMCILKH